jgi:hypothetical protein
MAEGQILKAVDSAIEGGGERLELIVIEGMSLPPLLPSPPPSLHSGCQRFCGKPSKAALCRF